MLKKMIKIMLLIISLMLINNSKIKADVNDSTLVRNYYDGYYLNFLLHYYD